MSWKLWKMDILCTSSCRTKLLLKSSGMSQDTLGAFWLRWSIKLLLSYIISIPLPSCEKACLRKCQARCPCQNGGICKGKGICACPPGWTVRLPALARADTTLHVIRGGCQNSKLAHALRSSWLPSSWQTDSSLNADLFLKPFRQQPVTSGDA